MWPSVKLGRALPLRKHPRWHHSTKLWKMQKAQILVIVWKQVHWNYTEGGRQHNKSCRIIYNLYIGLLHFKGEILQVDLGNLKKLQILSSPQAFSTCQALRVVILDENMFSGNLPADLGSGISSLETLICANNNLSGFISATISNASRLGMIDLSINNSSQVQFLNHLVT